jgi:hypothetical protein
MNRLTRYISLAVGVVLSTAMFVVPSAPAAEVAAGPQRVHGSNARPIRDADGRVNSAATISRLQDVHADSHMFLVAGQTDWDDLRLEFAAAAQAAGIKVWVYLLPPSHCEEPDGSPDPSCSHYLPYKKRYDDWARAIASLSVQYPVVTAWAIDDFANSTNLSYFTPAYMREVQRVSRAIKPSLHFYPVVYHDKLTAGNFLADYASVMDSVVMPYRDDPYRNTLWTGTLTAQLDSASARLAEYGRKLILMVYALNLSNTQVAPDVDYVQRITTTGVWYTLAGTIAGVVQYGFPLTPGKPGRGDINFSRGDGNGALMLTVRAAQVTSAGDWAAARATIRFNTGSDSCFMRLWHTDNRGIVPDKTGFHAKQVLVDGQVIWSRDVFNDDTAWLSTSMDVSQRLAASGGSADLSLRLYELAGVNDVHVRASFDDISLTGCHLIGGNNSFELVGGWYMSRNGGAVLAGQHIYDPVYSTRVFDMVADLYELF